MASATRMAYQMPISPMIMGSTMTAPHSKTRVRTNEMTADTRPLLSAVKNAEP